MELLMKNRPIYRISLLALPLFSSVANAGFYIGAEAGYKYNDIQHVKPLVKPDQYFDSKAENKDIYSNDNIGGRLSIGYTPSTLPFSIEAGFYKGSSSYKEFKVPDYGYDAVAGKVETSSFDINVLTHYQIPESSLSIIGLAGVIYQESDISKVYTNTVACTAVVGADCPPYMKTKYKESFYDTRMQLGVGVSYDINDQFTLRSMINFIPAGFSVGKGTPYTVNAGIFYNF